MITIKKFTYGYDYNTNVGIVSYLLNTQTYNETVYNFLKIIGCKHYTKDVVFGVHPSQLETVTNFLKAINEEYEITNMGE